MPYCYYNKRFTYVMGRGKSANDKSRAAIEMDIPVDLDGSTSRAIEYLKKYNQHSVYPKRRVEIPNMMEFSRIFVKSDIHTFTILSGQDFEVPKGPYKFLKAMPLE